MARSQKDDPLFRDIHTWNYSADNVENCAAGKNNQPPNQNAMNDKIFGHPNNQPNSFGAPNNVYLNKHPYNMGVPVPDSLPNHEEVSMNNVQGLPRTSNLQNYGNAVLNLGNGQIVRVYYDENNQRIMIPVTGQYELFNHSQGICDMPLQQQPQPPQIFSLNQEYSVNNNVRIPQLSTVSQQSNSYTNDNVPANAPTSNFLKEVLGNWEPNSSGTYSPFGQNYPLNHPDAPLLRNSQPPVLDLTTKYNANKIENMSPNRNDAPLPDSSGKKRIVAEVKPMRPSYSDVLAKNTKNINQADVSKKTAGNMETKSTNKLNNSKAEKHGVSAKQHYDDHKHKHENRKLINTASSGSESGDFTADDNEKQTKPSRKSKNKQNNSRKWSSLEDVSKDGAAYNHEGSSQFVFIENPEKPLKKEKKFHDKAKHVDRNLEEEEDYQVNDEDQSQYELHESHGEVKSRRKKESRSYSYKSPKPSQDKKKPAQAKWKRNKPGYLGVAQQYLENWWTTARRAIVWFIYLISDVCRMSAHLSFDLCTSVFTQSYVSSQAVWRSSKVWLRKLADNRCLHYLDRRLGHTRFGFWRRIKWFKKEADQDNENEANKLNANIPLPATGDDAMKRLLACMGKDPYSILGVSPSCSDADIKRYYRRQAFLVHPDKNTQPGAEEAFKILQHAFDLIGEPARRSAYDRAALESRHAEAAWSELGELLARLHDKMEFAHNTIRCTNCGRRHKRVLTERPCYAARYCAQCKIRHSAKEGDIWAESSMFGLLVMYYACMDGAVYQITEWASCQKKNLRQLRPDCHLVQYRIVLGSKAANDSRPAHPVHDPNLEEFLNSLYGKSGAPPPGAGRSPENEPKKRRAKKTKA